MHTLATITSTFVLDTLCAQFTLADWLAGQQKAYLSQTADVSQWKGRRTRSQKLRYQHCTVPGKISLAL